MPEDTGQKLDIDWLKTIAGALAAVSSAVLLSTLGAAGTIIGAALGSVVATVGGALYSQGLVRSRQRLVQVPTVARRRVGTDPDGTRRDRVVVAVGPADPGWRERFRMLPWRRISLVAAALFVATLVVITAFELAAGKPVSSMTGGSDGDGRTTFSRLGGGSGGGTSTDDDDKAPADGSSPSGGPSSVSSDLGVAHG